MGCFLWILPTSRWWLNTFSLWSILDTWLQYLLIFKFLHTNVFCLCRLVHNCDLITLYFVGVASLIPYLPIFLTQLGLSSTELSTIYGLIFFTTFVKNTLVGYVADKYQLHKIILIVSCVLTGPLYCSLVAVPAIKPVESNSSDIMLHCVRNISCSDTADVNITDFSVYSLYECHNGTEDCKRYATGECSISSCLLVQNTHNSSTSAADSIIPIESHIINISGLKLPHQDLTPCLLSLKCTSKPKAYTSLTFWICLSVMLMAALCGSNEMMLNDAIVLTILGKKVELECHSV